MPNISKINLNGTIYDVKDSNALTATEADSRYVEKITTTNNAVYVQQSPTVTTTISMDQNTAYVKQIVTKDSDYQIYKSTYSGGVGALLDQNVLNKEETNTLITSKNYATQSYVSNNYVPSSPSENGAYVIEDGNNIVIPLDTMSTAAGTTNICTKDGSGQIEKANGDNVITENSLFVPNGDEVVDYVASQLATVQPKINVVYGNALPTQAQMYQYCVQYNNGTALLRYKPSSGSDLLIPLCTLSLLGSGNFTAIFEFTSVSGSRMTKRCYIVSGSNSGGSTVSTLNQTEWIFN